MAKAKLLQLLIPLHCRVFKIIKDVRNSNIRKHIFHICDSLSLSLSLSLLFLSQKKVSFLIIRKACSSGNMIWWYLLWPDPFFEETKDLLITFTYIKTTSLLLNFQTIFLFQTIFGPSVSYRRFLVSRFGPQTCSKTIFVIVILLFLQELFFSDLNEN